MLRTFVVSVITLMVVLLFHSKESPSTPSDPPHLREREKFEDISAPVSFYDFSLFPYQFSGYGELPKEEITYAVECTSAEVELLACVIYHEVGNCESYDLKLKVGSVVINRVTEDTYFPNTISEVVYQKNQFSNFNDYPPQNVEDIYPDGYNEESMKAAKYLILNGSVLPERVQVFYLLGTYDPWLNSRETYCVEDYDVLFAYID